MKLRTRITRRRFKKIITKRKAKWAGLAVCALLAAVYVSSRWMGAIVRTSSTTGLDWHASVAGGRLEVGRFFFSANTRPERHTSWRFDTLDEPQLRLWVNWDHLAESFGVGHTYVQVPLWMPLLLLAIPTAWLWRRDRRLQPWQCRGCRYDLHGLEGGGEKGVCPECGLAKGEG